MASEKAFENRIKKHLKERGCWYVKYWAGSPYTKSGIPDLLCCIGGVFVAIEVKGKGGRASDLQRYTIEQIKESGGLAMILYPEQWDEFVKMVDILISQIGRVEVEL